MKNDDRTRIEGRQQGARTGVTCVSESAEWFRRVRLSTAVIRYLLMGVVHYGAIAFIVISVVVGVIGTSRATEDYSIDFLLLLPILLRAVGQSLLYTGPIALLLGASLLVGRLRADRELLALSASGVSPIQLLSPVILLGGLLGSVNYLGNQYLVPEWRFMNRNIAGYVLRHLSYFGEGRDLELDIGDYSLWVERYSGSELEGIFLTARGGGGPVSAKVLKNVETPTYPLYLIAQHAFVRTTGGETPVCSIGLERVTVFIDHDFFTDSDERSDFVQRGDLASWSWTLKLDQKSRSVKDLPAPQLSRYRAKQWASWHEAERTGDAGAALEARRLYLSTLREEFRRLASALSCLTFPLAAFGIGLLTTSANRLLPFFIAGVLVPAIFFGGGVIGERLANAGHVPALSMQLGNLTLMALVSAAVWRSSRAPRKRRSRRTGRPPAEEP